MDLSDVRGRLLENRDAILSIASKVHKQIGLRDAPLDPDSAERAVELENLDVLFAIDAETREALRLITDAIERVDAGKYGLCTVCGSSIDPQRLRAIPYVDTCIHCARQREAEARAVAE
jgi:RNA polymerase-binding transcription factor DksA